MLGLLWTGKWKQGMEQVNVTDSQPHLQQEIIPATQHTSLSQGWIQLIDDDALLEIRAWMIEQVNLYRG